MYRENKEQIASFKHPGEDKTKLSSECSKERKKLNSKPSQSMDEPKPLYQSQNILVYIHSNLETTSSQLL
jgi:hypothetical protein